MWESAGVKKNEDEFLDDEGEREGVSEKKKVVEGWDDLRMTERGSEKMEEGRENESEGETESEGVKSESQQQHRVLRSNVVEILEERGLLESITSDSLRTACSDPAAGPLKGGFNESVRKRLESEQGMSYTEFTYQLLQGYDFLYLFQKEGVNVQIGGSDQWCTITAGTELIRKILQAWVPSAYGLTFPLLLKSDETKFGKSGWLLWMYLFNSMRKLFNR